MSRNVPSHQPDHQPDLPMSTTHRIQTRRSHKKSRRGCVTCKQRKIKCDETHPNCNNCTRRAIECKYLPITSLSTDDRSRSSRRQSSTAIPSTSNSASSSTNSTSTSSSNSISPHIQNRSSISLMGSYSQNEPFPQFLEWSTMDLQLILHFSTSFYLRLSTKPVLRNIWCTALPPLAYKYNYLMRMLLAISALDFEYNAPNDKKLVHNGRSHYDFLAKYHQTKSLEDFKYCLHPQNSDEAIAVMCTSFFNLIFLTASPEHRLSDADFFKIAKGIKPVFFESQAAIASSVFAPLIQFYGPKNGNIKSSDFPHYLYQLLNIQDFETERLTLKEFTEIPTIEGFSFDFYNRTPVLSSSSQSSRNITANENTYRNNLLFSHVYLSAISDLEREFSNIYNIEDPETDYISVISRWVSFVPNEFVTLIDQDDPRALIIVAHFIMLLYSLPNIWWLTPLQDELDYIEARIRSQEWARFLKLPRMVSEDLARWHEAKNLEPGTAFTTKSELLRLNMLSSDFI